MAKGNASCHIPNDKYREGWELIFGNSCEFCEEKATYEYVKLTSNEVGIMEVGPLCDKHADFYRNIPNKVVLGFKKCFAGNP